MSTRMSPDDVTFLKNMIDEQSIDDFKSIKYDKVEKLIKSNLLETNTEGVVSDYLIRCCCKWF